MKTLQIWNPFNELESMQHRFAKMLGDDWKDLTVSQNNSFLPKVDISEDKEAYRFKVELPEVKKEDIKVEFEHGVMTISGQKKFESESKDDAKKYHRIERSYGSFMRSFTLPDVANTETVNAEFLNGVLDIKVAKKAISAPVTKTITIK